MGATGHFLSVATTIAFGLYLFVVGNNLQGYGSELSGWTVFLSFLLFVGLVPQLFAFYGMARNYRSRMSAATFVIGLVAVIFFLVGTVWAQSMVSSGYFGNSTYYSDAGALLLYLSWVAIGVLFILEGVAYILTRHLSGNPSASIVTGILFVVGGSFVSSIILPVVFLLFNFQSGGGGTAGGSPVTSGGFFVLVPGLVIGGITLLHAPLPLTRTSRLRH